MGEPLSKDTFETFNREHQKYLDSKFDKLAGCIDGVKASVEEIKGAREKAWEKQAELCKTMRDECNDCQKKEIKKVHKYLVVGCVAATLLGAILAPYLGWQHLLGFFTKLLTGHVPIGM